MFLLVCLVNSVLCPNFYISTLSLYSQDFIKSKNELSNPSSSCSSCCSSSQPNPTTRGYWLSSYPSHHTVFFPSKLCQIWILNKSLIENICSEQHWRCSLWFSQHHNKPLHLTIEESNFLKTMSWKIKFFFIGKLSASFIEQKFFYGGYFFVTIS